MKPKITGFVWNCDGDEFVYMVELPEQKRAEIERLLAEHETEGESFPLVREEN